MYRTIKYWHTALIRRKKEKAIALKNKGWEKEIEELEKIYRDISDNYKLSSNKKQEEDEEEEKEKEA